MRKFSNLSMLFSEMDEETKRSIKGGSGEGYSNSLGLSWYQTYVLGVMGTGGPGSGTGTDWWHNFNTNTDVIDAGGVTITAPHVNTPQYELWGLNLFNYSIHNTDGWNNPGGNGSGGGGGGGNGYGGEEWNLNTAWQNITTYNFKDQMMSVLKDFWSSPTMRALIPDVVSINFSSSAVVGIGTGGTFALNIVTRGDAAAALTWTDSFRVGLHADASANASVGWMLGNVENASLDGILGLGVEGSLDFEAVGVGAWTSNDSTTGMPTWIGASIGGGPGVGGSVGITTTHVISVNGVPLVWDF